jgi:pimeloyl-ACP methyl ester carboxylesterase
MRPLLLALTLVCLGCTIAAHGSASARDGVARSVWVAAEDAKLYVLVRGQQRRAPILIWLHGGPGGAERPLFRYFNSDLERDFVVAYWDQRGAGRSFDPDADPAQLTIRQHLDDLDRVVDYLQRTFQQQKVALVGHSWGSALGLLYVRDHPEKVAAFVGTGQVVSTVDAARAQLEFVAAEARQRNELGALQPLLEQLGPPPLNWEQDLALQRWVERYGGVFHQPPRRWEIVLKAIALGYVTPWEIYTIIRANKMSLAAMNGELGALDLRVAVRTVNVPLLLMLGRHDRVTDPALAQAYFAALAAPRKCLIWCEGSAHNMPFEEPDRFNTTVRDFLRSAATGSESPANCESTGQLTLKTAPTSALDTLDLPYPQRQVLRRALRP